MELTITTESEVIRNPEDITEDKIKNFEKKPTNGGIPAMDNKVNDNALIRVIFFVPFAVQFTK